MFDAATTAPLCAIFDEVCETVSKREIGPRSDVGSKILEAADQRRGIAGRDSRQAGRDTLSQAPTMWR